MTTLDEALAALDAHPAFVAAVDWPGSLRGLDGPGLYSWWVDQGGAEHLSRGLGVELPPGLIYVGQAGAASAKAKIPSAATLRTRIEKNHLRGRVRTSTLRRTLASVLLGPQALTLVGPARLDRGSEVRLGEWMRRHLSLAVCAADSAEDLHELEHEVVAALRPPLNLEHLPDGELNARLRELRSIVTHGIDDLWVAPDHALSDWREILAEYGQAFDGYRYAAAVRKECPAIADEVWRRYRADGHFSSSFAELRCALFWLQRWVHNAEQAPGWTADDELRADARHLHAEIERVWRNARATDMGHASRQRADRSSLSQSAPGLAVTRVSRTPDDEEPRSHA